MARTTWTDNFTVNADPALLGKLGEMTVKLRISGDLMTGGTYPGENAYLRVFLRIYDSYGADTRFQGGTMYKVDNDGIRQVFSVDGALIGPGLWQETFQFHFGRAAYLTAWVEVHADARSVAHYAIDGYSYGEANCYFGEHTNDFGLVWEGVSDVRLTNGSPVTGFTITSDSGFDYLLGAITNPPVITRIQVLRQALELECTDLGPRSYTVETSSTLSPGNWAPVQGVAWPIHTNTVILPLPPQSPAFFRIRVQ